MLSTSPNAALPAGARLRVIEDALVAAPIAAGMIYVAPGGRVLLLKRSAAATNYAGHWAFPGGKGEPGEAPLDAARRESGEEIGTAPDGDAIPIDETDTSNGMVFHTFAQRVPEEFQPRLNDEHSEHAWAPLNDLPEPLHPGVARVLREKGDQIARDATGLEELHRAHPQNRAVTKLEEQESAKLAGDTLEVLAFDRESVRTYDKDGRLHVAISNISKAAVNPYRGSEIPGWADLGLDPHKIYQLFRDPEELAKAAKTFNGLPILRRHIPTSAEDHQTQDVIGASGTDASFEHPFLRNSLVFWPQEAINDIESGKRSEISSAYSYKPDMTPGAFEGKPFDGVMRNLAGNHLIICPDGRAGSDVVVGDSSAPLLWEEIERALSEI